MALAKQLLKPKTKRSQMIKRRVVRMPSGAPSRKAKTIGERLPRPNLIRMSDVIGIPLSDSCYAYARAVGKASLAALAIKPTATLLTLRDVISQKPQHAFFVEYYEPTDSPEWIYLGKWPFESAEEAKSPPVYFHHQCKPGHVIILDNGTHREALLSNVSGLQEHGLKAHATIVSMIENHFRRSLLRFSRKRHPK